MKQVILIHGAPYESEFYDKEKPSPSNGNWFPWLQKQLAMRGILSQALEMPKPYDPTYESWEAVLDQMKLSPETILIGHSCGGGFLLRYLSERSEVGLGKIILVAPWLDPEPHELTTQFFNFNINPELGEKFNIHVFLSTDDFEGCLKSFETIKKVLPNLHYHEFNNKQHFATKEFSEILELL